MGNPQLKADHPSPSFMKEMLSYLGDVVTTATHALEAKGPTGGAGNDTIVDKSKTIPWGARTETTPYLEGGKPDSLETGQTIPAIFKTFRHFLGVAPDVQLWEDALREVEGTFQNAFNLITGGLTLDFGELEDAIRKTNSKEKASFGDAIHEGAAGLDAKTHVEGAPLIPTKAKVHEVAKADAEVKDHVKDHEKMK